MKLQITSDGKAIEIKHMIQLRIMPCGCGETIKGYRYYKLRYDYTSPAPRSREGTYATLTTEYEIEKGKPHPFMHIYKTGTLVEATIISEGVVKIERIIEP